MREGTVTHVPRCARSHQNASKFVATFTINMLGKDIHYKNTRRKHDMIEYEERDQAKKTLKSGSLSSKKDTRRSLKK